MNDGQNDDNSMTDPVRAQYENYPYPPRDPADEASRLIVGSPSHILEINHFLFNGRRDFSQLFRALFAGGGTGDATIMLAQQLADIEANAEIIYLDISEASKDVAQARAQARGLTNIQFVTGSLNDLPTLGLGEFDYIDCCGVLHHLEDPVGGMSALRGALLPHGGMGVMLYAPLGRTGVYHVQALVRMMSENTAHDVKLDIARRTLNSLPPTNWLKRNPFVGDHTALGDAGIYDLLLHARDRAYSIMEIAELITRAEMRLVTFLDPLRYEPAIYIQDEELAPRIRAMPAIQRCAFAELLCGNMKTHRFYAVRGDHTESTVALADSPDAVPVLREMDGAAMAREMATSRTMTVELDGIKAGFNLPQMAPAIFMLIDGKRSLTEIHEKIVAAAPENAAPKWDDFM
ncbi:MAG: class I SAM-dependent methyltransferase, partial [Rhodospirillaceae bacterium]|nr:class I SAM-dependent methyltransferase [Rhodospirillaceae bacterium]